MILSIGKSELHVSAQIYQQFFFPLPTPVQKILFGPELP
jgi:hypothetical protein